MKNVIEQYKKIIIQIATPYSTGTGFYLKEPNLIVTNAHVVSGNRDAVVDGWGAKKQLAKVLYTDLKYDLAFLEAPNGHEMPDVPLGAKDAITEGDKVVAIGHPFGFGLSVTDGIVSNIRFKETAVPYLQHTAALNPGNSGGPLINAAGEVVGVNTFIIQNGNNMGFSLPVHFLDEAIEEFIKQGQGRVGARCHACSNLVFEHTIEGKFCPHCGKPITLPSKEEEYVAGGIAKTIEGILETCGHEIRLARRGPNFWEVKRGSACIKVVYHEPTGHILGDAVLCDLPRQNIGPIYEYLLRQNYELEGLTFSVSEQEIVLSLIIFDKYLNLDTGLKLFTNLFEKADYFDNILVEEYGATWKEVESGN